MLNGVPTEIRFCNLRVSKLSVPRFPSDAPFLPRAIAFNIPRKTADLPIILLRFYNGGSLASLLEELERQGRNVPEAFIWHFSKGYGPGCLGFH